MKITEKHIEEITNALAFVRPAMEADGGGVDLHSIDNDGTVYVKLKGACLSCPSAKLTLKFGLEATLKSKVSWVSTVKRFQE